VAFPSPSSTSDHRSRARVSTASVIRQ
jgi:hypothetical protein